MIPPGQPVLEARGLSKEFRSRAGAGTVALQDVSVTVNTGEFLTLLGPSGCGKTTLLRLFAGLEKATTGSVRMMGSELTRPSTDGAVVFQSAVLLPWRSIIQNVMIPAEIRGVRLRDVRDRAEQLLEMTGLIDFKHHYPRELSGGMRQRAAICRALLLDPPVLFMDEPFGALDALTRSTLNEELYSVWKRTGKTIVFVTHDISEAVRLSTSVVVMSARPGRIREVKPIDLGAGEYADRIGSAHFGEYVRDLEVAVYQLLHHDAESTH